MSSTRHASFKRAAGFAAVFAALLALSIFRPELAQAQQQQAGKSLRLAGVEFAGLARVSKEQAVGASGLQIGQRVTVEDLDAAAQRLLDSGLFTKLSYRLRTSNDQASVTFQVEEQKGGGVPVVFDNFVWFTNEELTSAVRGEVPLFDGTAPERGGVIQSITKALERLLRERNIAGQVNYTPSADTTGRNPRHVFSVSGSAVKVCGVRFPGSAGVGERELVKNSKGLLGTEYSQEFASAFAHANLIPVYKQHGHLKAKFGQPAAAVGSGECRDGVVVTLPVTEGVSYTWDKAEWAGNEAYPARDLDSPLGMKPGAIADGLRIEEGLKAVERLYGRKGYLQARVTGEPVYDDENRRVAYRVAVAEGPRYTMSTLTIKGLPEADADYLKERWKLKQGAAYDNTYLKEFVEKEIIKDFVERAMRTGRMKYSAKLPKVEPNVKLNPQALNVDVTIEVRELDLE
ncbi:MAG TPA: POTRA domain-containing protein [Pyrinomonadaceae bacterium]|nr:POTRA domain-containing protein [Pyrinomonadaceae bacterium]